RRSCLHGRIRPRCGAGSCCSDGLLHLAALEAAGADVCPGRLALEEHADALQVGVEAALGGHHRVAPTVTEAGLLPTDCAALGHRPGSVADNPKTAGVLTQLVQASDRTSCRSAAT